ncbi:hypothetical protein JTE90_023408 [Oedothorax gibbosus]|uniref:Mitotic spindle assembly checkpoint protein MAD1 n=1 Tax=Oedothorax gibbosus TaxID=931172 RepID=A0AAV6UFK9_9ARAC|nr:hypothetical protein JTE90_023408 [Oedothorax gibbosus]
MATPKDNTEVIRMMRDVKNSIMKSLTPMRTGENSFNEYLSSLTNIAGAGSNRMQPQTIAARLNFSGFDEMQTSESSKFRPYETPEALKRKLMHTEVELQASLAKVKERESLISVMEPANKRMCTTLENQLEKAKRQNELDAQKIEELQQKLKWAKRQALSIKSQLNEAERSKKIGVDKQDIKTLALQEECSNLKLELADVKSEKTETVRKLHMEIGKLEMRISMLNEEKQKSEEYIQSLKRQNSEMAEKVALCNSYQEELKEANQKIQALENKIEANKDAALIIASRQEDLKCLMEMQKENRILKEELSKYKESNVMLYQEKMWSMQEKLSHAEKKCIALAKLQVENEQLKGKLGQWEELFDDKSSPNKTPTSFSRRLSQYQQNEAIMTNKLSHLSSRCDVLEKQKNEREETIKILKNRIEQCQQNFSRQDSVIKRLQRKIMFLSKEKDNCRKLLDSYLSEATISGIALNAAQVSHLEEMNTSLQQALEKSEKEVDELHKKIKNFYDNSKTEEVSAEVTKLRNENAGLSAEIANLQNHKAELESKLSKPPQTDNSSESSSKILHLRFNPLDTANKRHLEHFHKLQEENDQLKKRVKVLEEEGVGATDITMKVVRKLESEGSDSSLQGLKDQLAASEKKIQFILENARTKSTEFREAVYRLTGYCIDVPTAETYKLSHVYADSSEDYLLFKINSEGVQLIETEYSKHVSHRMDVYLRQYDSFPAFLASLTMDLFNQQTFMLESTVTINL